MQIEENDPIKNIYAILCFLSGFYRFIFLSLDYDFHLKTWETLLSKAEFWNFGNLSKLNKTSFFTVALCQLIWKFCMVAHYKKIREAIDNINELQCEWLPMECLIQSCSMIPR